MMLLKIHFIKSSFSFLLREKNRNNVDLRILMAWAADLMVFLLLSWKTWKTELRLSVSSFLSNLCIYTYLFSWQFLIVLFLQKINICISLPWWLSSKTWIQIFVMVIPLCLNCFEANPVVSFALVRFSLDASRTG